MSEAPRPRPSSRMPAPVVSMPAPVDGVVFGVADMERVAVRADDGAMLRLHVDRDIGARLELGRAVRIVPEERGCQDSAERLPGRALDARDLPRDVEIELR